MASEPLLTKDAINIGGHKFPIALVGGLAAVAGVLLILRARSQGSAVSAGNVPGANTGVNPVVDFSGASSADSAALANLNQQLTGIQQSINTPTTPAPQLRAVQPNDNPIGFPGGFPGAGTPIFSLDPKHQGIIGYLAPGTSITGATAATGLAGDPGFDINYGGVQGFVPGRYTVLG